MVVKRSLCKQCDVAVLGGFVSTARINPPTITNYQNNRFLCHDSTFDSIRIAARILVYALQIVMQSIFSAASRRDTLGRHSKVVVATGKAKNRLDKTAAQRVAYGY